jgi:cytochrome c peroxidase
VQIVDVPGRKVAREMPLGPKQEPSLARQGEAIFYDGRRSLDQWYSCHSCHYEGHTNAVAMDTRNDGRDRNFKTVLSLRNVTRTGPWTWHGWQKSIELAMTKSLTDSMLGPPPKEGEVEALVAYLDTLRPPPNPHRNPDGSLTEAAKRGEAVFRGRKADCIRCHNGDYFTDNKIHDVNTGERGDAFKGYNTPSLVNVFDKVKYLHDGRAKSLEQALTGAHDPDIVTGEGKLTPEELADLLAYLRSL